MKTGKIVERDGTEFVQPRPWSLIFLGILAVIGGLGAIPASRLASRTSAIDLSRAILNPAR